MIVSSIIKYSFGKMDDSITCLEKIIELDAQKATAWFHLGEAYGRKKI